MRLAPMGERGLPQHIHALKLSKVHKKPKAVVPKSKIMWTVPYEKYKPIDYEDPGLAKLAEEDKKPLAVTGNRRRRCADVDDVLKAIPASSRHERMSFELRKLGDGYQDKEHTKLVDAGFDVYPASRASDDVPEEHIGAIIFDKATGRPINPRGRTGMSGRGVLGFWGPNHAADPIVTRWDPDYPDGEVLQVVAVHRKDTDEWALPGGLVDAYEPPLAQVLREFNDTSSGGNFGLERTRMEKHVKQLFQDGEEIYRGYVDDARNTDNAWLETTATFPRVARARDPNEPQGG